MLGLQRSLVVAISCLLFALVSCGGGGGGSNPTAILQGRLISPDGTPMVGMTVRLANGGATTKSDSDGRFRLAGVGSGAIVDGKAAVVFDATTSVPASTFRVRMNMPLTAGTTSSLPTPMVIPIPVPGSETTLHGESEQAVYAAGHPGAGLRVPAGCVNLSGAACTDPNQAAALSMTYIPRHQLPGGLPGGMVSDVVFSIQPSGAVFETPVPVSLPNYDGFAPGENVPIMQVNPETGEWEEVARGTVTANGTLIQSDAGQGVRWGSCTGCCYQPCLGTISGRVSFIEIDPTSGQQVEKPAVDALVWASFGVQVRADANGEYQLDNVPIGNCSQSQGPFDVVVTASLDPEGGDPRLSKTVSISNNGSAQVDFLFEGLSLEFWDDENDGQRALDNQTVAGGADGKVDAVTADGATSVLIKLVVADSANSPDVEVRVWLDTLESTPGNADLGTLQWDVTANDGSVDANYGGGWLTLADLEAGAGNGANGASLRYLAPNDFGVAEPEPDEDGRDHRFVALRAEGRRPSKSGQGAGFDTFLVTLEPVKLKVIRPQLFFVHGILNDRNKWALEAGLPGLGGLDQTAMFFCPQSLTDNLKLTLTQVGRTQFLDAMRPTMGNTQYSAMTADYGPQNMSPLDDTWRVVHSQLIALETELRGQGVATSRFDVVGHSYGGLNARRIIAESTAAANVDPRVGMRIRKLATMGTPHLGSTISDRMLNMARATSPATPGASELLDDLMTSIDDRGLFSICATDMPSVNAINREASGIRTAHSDLATAERMKLAWSTWGFDSDVDYRFFYGTLAPSFDLEDSTYGFGARAVGDIPHTPSDAVVAAASARAGRAFEAAAPLEGQNHTELVSLANLRPALAWFATSLNSVQPPVQQTTEIGPVIQKVSNLDLRTFSGNALIGYQLTDYQLELSGTGLTSSVGGVVKIHFKTNRGQTVTRTAVSSTVDTTNARIRFSRDGIQIPGDLPQLVQTFPFDAYEFVSSCWVTVEVDGKTSNQVWIPINKTSLFTPMIMGGPVFVPSPPSQELIPTDSRFEILIRHGGPTLSAPTVTVAGWPATDLEVIQTQVISADTYESRLQFVVPTNASSGQVVFREGLTERSDGVQLSLTPRVDQLSLSLAQPGSIVGISGAHFGLRREDVTVRIGSVDQSVVLAGGSELAFVVADGTTSGPVQVSVQGVAAINAPFLAVAADSDSDGMPDLFELQYGFDAQNPNDATGDADGDSVSNRDEHRAGTNPLLADTDGGGVDDGVELAVGMNPTSAIDDSGDQDGDGLSVAQEFALGTSPLLFDSDADGLGDGVELNALNGYATSPLDIDTDDDGLSDGDEVLFYSTNPLIADTDGDGLTDGAEVRGDHGPATNPRVADSDGDGLNDGDELLVHGTNPLLADTDSDGLVDGQEITLGTDPNDRDSDGDGLVDGFEAQNGTNPLVLNSTTRLTGIVRLAAVGVSGATVTLNGVSNNYYQSTSGAQGAFDLGLWPTSLTSVQASANYTDTAGVVYQGNSAVTQVSTATSTSLGIIQLDPIAISNAQPYPLAVVTPGHQTDVALSVDVNDDDRVDMVAVTSDRDFVLVSLNLGDGVFAAPLEHPISGFATDIASADLDADGHVDLVVVHAFDDLTMVLWGDGDGGFEAETSFSAAPWPDEVELCDLDFDGRLDIVVAHTSGTGLSRHRNLGQRNFSSPTFIATASQARLLRVGDFDDDGRSDLAFAHNSSNSNVRVLRNAPGGLTLWQNLIVGIAPWELVVQDLTGGPEADLAAIDYFSGELTVLENTGSSLIPFDVYSSADAFRSLAAGDIDGDGVIEVCATTRYQIAGYDSVSFQVLSLDPIAGIELVDSMPLGQLDVRSIELARIDDDSFADMVIHDDRRGQHVFVRGRSPATFDAPRFPSDSPGLFASTLGEVNGDGRLDLVESSIFGLSVRLRQSDGSFAAPQIVDASTFAFTLEVQDLTGDGLGELIWIDSLSELLVARNQGALVFGPTQSFVIDAESSLQPSPRHAFADLDGDGKKDFLSLEEPQGLSTTMEIRRNLDGWNFGAVQTLNFQLAVESFVVADLAGDAKPDLVLAASSGFSLATLEVVILPGGPSFGTFGTALNHEVDSESLLFPSGLAVADFDGNGRNDVSVAYFGFLTGSSDLTTRLGWLFANGTGTLGTPQIEELPQFMRDLRAIDLNGDGRTDLAGMTAVSGAMNLALRSSLDGGNFAPWTHVAVETPWVEFVDFNSDGKFDIFDGYAAPQARVLLRR